MKKPLLLASPRGGTTKQFVGDRHNFNLKLEMKKLVILFTAALITAGCSTTGRQADADTGSSQTTTAQQASAQASSATTAQFVSYENALNTAKTSNKLVFVDIYTGWCTWCKKLDKEVYSDPQVQAAFAKNFAITKLDAEADTKHTYLGTAHSEKDIANSWNVSAFPTLVFLDKTEKPIYAYAGYLPPKDFIKLLDFVSTGAYQKQGADFRNYLTTHAG